MKIFLIDSSAECPRMLGSPIGNSELALIDLTNPHQLAACWTISLQDFIFSHLRRLQKTHQTPKGTDPSRYSAPRVPSYYFLETKTFSSVCIMLGKMKRDLEKYQFLAPPAHPNCGDVIMAEEKYHFPNSILENDIHLRECWAGMTAGATHGIRLRKSLSSVKDQREERK